MGPRYHAVAWSEYRRQGLSPQRGACSATISSGSYRPARTLTSPGTRGAAGTIPCASQGREGHRRRAPGRREHFALNRGSGWGWGGGMGGAARGESLEDAIGMVRCVRSSARPRSTRTSLATTYPGRSPASPCPSRPASSAPNKLTCLSRRRPWIDVSAPLIRQLGGPACGRGRGVSNCRDPGGR